MRGKIISVFEIELFLTALLGRACCRKTTRFCVVKDCGTELFVHEDAGFFLSHTIGDSGDEAVIDHSLSGSDLGCLIRGEGAFPTEHFGLKRAAMVEGQDVQRLAITASHGKTPSFCG